MGATITIEDKGCRGCTICVDVCPVDVFDFDDNTQVASVARADDCIGCLTCFYGCPSQCVAVTGIEMLRPFHRIERNVALVERFLQEKTAVSILTDDDYTEAQQDVNARLTALAEAVTDTMGRGQRAVGRKAGTAAAAHLPEMYEEAELEGVLSRMQQRFRHCFDFDYSVSLEGAVEVKFEPCALAAVVEQSGQKVGEAVLCQLFHEYLAGLLGTFASRRFRCTEGESGVCSLKLEPQ